MSRVKTEPGRGCVAVFGPVSEVTLLRPTHGRGESLQPAHVQEVGNWVPSFCFFVSLFILFFSFSVFSS